MAAAGWITGRHCEKCGKSLSDNDPGPLCFSCAETGASGRQHSFDKGYACTSYDSVAQSVIFALKYGSRSDIGSNVGEILYDRMLSEFDADELAGMYDLVIPVPIYLEKKKKRGYNHADLMAESFASRAGIRCESEALIRTKATKPMKGLGPEERKANISGAFDIRDRKRGLIQNSRILLVDDIYTTGATIDEIAGALKRSWTDSEGRTHSGASVVDFLAYATSADYMIV
jgi:ComF family protein